MKKTITFLVLLCVTLAFAQVPNTLTYQAIVRDADQNILSNQTIGVDVKLRQGTASGITVYQETHTVATNTNGLVTFLIGDGITNNDFSTIDWSQGPYFIETSYDVTGGTNYTLSSTSQLLSVPYALYAETSGSSIPGPQGEAGVDGADGQNGVNGTNGINGVDGLNGVNGTNGTNG